MDYIKGTDLSEFWFNLQKEELASLMDQPAELYIPFFVYHAEDLKSLSCKSGTPLDGPFRIDPDVSPHQTTITTMNIEPQSQQFFFYSIETQ